MIWKGLTLAALTSNGQDLCHVLIIDKKHALIPISKGDTMAGTGR